MINMKKTFKGIMKVMPNIVKIITIIHSMMIVRSILGNMRTI